MSALIAKKAISELYSDIEQAVNSGFIESGLGGEVIRQEGAGFFFSLKSYAVILMEGFIHRDVMYERYQTQRACFAALVGDDYFDAVLGQIQAGDVALFHGGLFFGGVYMKAEARKAAKAYGDVAALLRGNRKSHHLFNFLHAAAPEVMEGLGAAAEYLNLPKKSNLTLYVPAFDRHLIIN